MLINTKAQIAELQNVIIQNAEMSYVALKELLLSRPSMEFWATVKFDRIGRDSINGQPQNLIEQINQMYSNLVVLNAANDLMDKYPGMSFELQLGVSSGYDIQSVDGSVVAECFAVTSVASNRKLDKDCQKLAVSDASGKYIYFYSHQDSVDKLQKHFDKYPGIIFKRITFSEISQTSTHS